MPLGDNIITQTQSQSRSLPGWFGGEKGLEYFFNHRCRNPSAVIADADNNLSPNPSPRERREQCCNRDRWLIISFPPGISFIHRKKSIVDQVQNNPPQVLWYYIYFSDRFVKDSFKFGIKGMILGPPPMIGQSQVLITKGIDIREFFLSATATAVL